MPGDTSQSQTKGRVLIAHLPYEKGTVGSPGTRSGWESRQLQSPVGGESDRTLQMMRVVLQDDPWLLNIWTLLSIRLNMCLAHISVLAEIMTTKKAGEGGEEGRRKGGREGGREERRRSH